MKKKFHWRLFILRWHRRIGLVLSIFLAWMLFTGVLLNHSDDLSLAKHDIANQSILSWYGISTSPDIAIGSHKLTLSTDGLWLEQQNLGMCEQFLGITQQAEMFVVVCSDRILLLTAQAELIDQIDSLRGLSTHLLAMSNHEQQIFVKDKLQIYLLNTDDLSLTPQPHLPPLNWLTPINPSARVSLERVLMDAHAGRFLGAWGKYMVDAFAIVLLALLFSGWFLAKRRHRKPDSV